MFTLALTVHLSGRVCSAVSEAQQRLGCKLKAPTLGCKNSKVYPNSKPHLHVGRHSEDPARLQGAIKRFELHLLQYYFFKLIVPLPLGDG